MPSIPAVVCQEGMVCFEEDSFDGLILWVMEVNRWMDDVSHNCKGD